jgi:hypothetical protein
MSKIIYLFHLHIEYLSFEDLKIKFRVSFLSNRNPLEIVRKKHHFHTLVVSSEKFYNFLEP